MLTELLLLPNQPTLIGKSHMCKGCLSNMLSILLSYLYNYSFIINLAKGGVVGHCPISKANIFLNAPLVISIF